MDSPPLDAWSNVFKFFHTFTENVLLDCLSTLVQGVKSREQGLRVLQKLQYKSLIERDPKVDPSKPSSPLSESLKHVPKQQKDGEDVLLHRSERIELGDAPSPAGLSAQAGKAVNQ